MQTPPWYVLTGGPSAGKTTLIQELRARGHKTVDEAARAYIEEQVTIGKDITVIRADEAAFQKALVARHRITERSLSKDEVTFFDRAAPDSVAYYGLIDLPIDDELRELIKECNYRKVFIMELIPFEKDAIRKETAEEAARLNVLLRKSYGSLGIPAVEVPVMPLLERTNFILDNL